MRLRWEILQHSETSANDLTIGLGAECSDKLDARYTFYLFCNLTNNKCQLYKVRRSKAFMAQKTCHFVQRKIVHSKQAPSPPNEVDGTAPRVLFFPIKQDQTGSCSLASCYLVAMASNLIPMASTW